MGKLAIISDLHVDINQLGEPELLLLLQVLQREKITRLHLAGDIANKVDDCLHVVRFFWQHGMKTTFNFGNHEMADVKGEAMLAHFPDTHYLNDRYIPLNEKKVLVGMNGWYDYCFASDKDQEKIERLKRMYWYDRYIDRDASDPEITVREVKKAKLLLDDLAEKGYQVVLATHFVPKKEFIVQQAAPYERWNDLNAFLGAESFGQLFDGYRNIEQVVFGHTHRRFEDQMIHGTKYSCRPFGYYYEWQITKEFVLANQLVTEYNPMKLRGVLRKNWAQFDAYRQQQLLVEYRRAMTIIDY